MKISIIQLNITRNAEKNFENAINFINKSNGKIVCLPELFLTGFENDTLNFAQDENSYYFKKLREISKEKEILLIAGMAEKSNECYYNSAFVFHNGKFKGTYRKINLFKFGGEDKKFLPGNKIFTYNYKEVNNGVNKVNNEVNIGIIICYDIRFPELCRRLMQKGVQILFVLANFPKERLKHWEILIRARAVENLFYVAGCNANNIEFEHGIDKFGDSLIVNPWGEILKISNDYEDGEIIEEELDINYLINLRKKYNFLEEVNFKFNINF